MRIPSEATLSRVRLKLDVLSMLCRQQQFQNSSGFFVMLSADSSPQKGLDFLMPLEDRVTRHAAGDLMLAGADPKAILAWSRDQGIQTSQLPLAIVASGNSALAGKFEAPFHQAGQGRSRGPGHTSNSSNTSQACCSVFMWGLLCPGKRGARHVLTSR